MLISVKKWSEGLNNKVCVIIKRYIDQVMFAAYMDVLLSHSVIFFCFHFVSLYTSLYFNCIHPVVILTVKEDTIFSQTQHLMMLLQRYVSTLVSHHQAIFRTMFKVYNYLYTLNMVQGLRCTIHCVP